MNLQTELLTQISQHNINVVDVHHPVTNPTEFIEYVRDLKGVEGFVIAWESGYRVKIKSSEYLLFHKTKESIALEKNIIDLLVNDKVDDAKAFMQTEDRERVEAFEQRFWDGFRAKEHELERGLLLAREMTGGDRKAFAVNIAPKMDPVARALFFQVWDGKRVLAKEMLAVIRKNTGSQPKLDTVRHLWGGCGWNYHWTGASE